MTTTMIVPQVVSRMFPIGYAGVYPSTATGLPERSWTAAMAAVTVCAPASAPRRRIGFMRSTKCPNAKPTSCGSEGHHHAAEEQPEASVPQGRQEDRAGMNPGQADESREPERRHEGDGAVGNAPEQGIMRAQMADQKSSEQRADAAC